MTTVPFTITSNTVFTPLHTYWIAPAGSGGSDSNDGLAATVGGGHGPWLTPAGKTLVCGDVIIAVSGAYSSSNFKPTATGGNITHWSTPTSCPSSSGGIDGAGGIYVVPLICETPFTCSCGQMWVDASHWSIQGFVINDTSSLTSVGIQVSPTQAADLSYVALVNNVCTGASLGAFYGGISGIAGGSGHSVDEFAIIGNLAFNSAQTSSVCGSNLAVNSPKNVDALSGTHIAILGNYSYGGINGVCGPNVNFNGLFTTANGSVGSGSSTITLTSVSGAQVGYPIAVQNTSGAIIAGIPQPNWITNIAGNVVTLNTPTNATIANGASIAVGQSTDGDGIILDTWALFPYTGQTYIAQNMLWGNGGDGLILLCGNGTTCASGLNINVNQNTFYGNLQDYKHFQYGSELIMNTGSLAGWNLALNNNIFQSTVTTPASMPSTFKNVPTTGNGIGNPVVAGSLTDGATLSGNYFKSAAGATCPTGGTCNGTDDIIFQTNNYSTGNTFGTDAGFSNTSILPTTSPNCSGFENTALCMASVQAGMTPSGGAATKGYQPPSSVCATNSLHPAWTKGIVYLHWNGSAVEQRAGLITMPCGV